MEPKGDSEVLAISSAQIWKVCKVLVMLAEDLVVLEIELEIPSADGGPDGRESIRPQDRGISRWCLLLPACVYE